MEKLLLLGINEKLVTYTCSQGKAEYPTYTLFGLDEDTGTLYKIQFGTIYEDCGSGYTSATKGFNTSWEVTDTLLPFHYVPKEKYRYVEFEPNPYGNVDIYEDRTLIYHDGDGGCMHYPEGETTLDKDLLKTTVRHTDKRVIYVFTGEPVLGKSTLANSSSLKSYEVEQSKSLPDDLEQYDIIVCSTKSERCINTSLNAVESHLSEYPVHIVYVNFTSNRQDLN